MSNTGTPPSVHSLRKQPTFRNATTGFPAKRRLRNEHKNSILITRHHPDLVSVLVVPRGKFRKFASSNAKHYPDLGSDTFSVWNFCSRFAGKLVWTEASRLK